MKVMRVKDRRTGNILETANAGVQATWKTLKEEDGKLRYTPQSGETFLKPPKKEDGAPATASSAPKQPATTTTPPAQVT